jgi:arsenate reductase (thioredoxin)
MADRPYNVLFLCTGNSARSILAEALLNRDGGDRFRAYSAGSFPKGDVHPMSLELLSSLGFDTSGLRSKSWDEFAQPGAPEIDFIFTVCDDANGEVCPVWPGHPMTAHWGIEDPAAVTGPGQRDAFLRAMTYLKQRISLFLALPIDSIDKLALRQKLREIGCVDGATATATEQA